VVADALLTQRDVCEQIVAGGGEYLLPVKANQPAWYRGSVEAFSPAGSGDGMPGRPYLAGWLRNGGHEGSARRCGWMLR